MSNTPSPRFDPSSIEAAVFDIGGVFCYPAFKPLLEWMNQSEIETPDDVLVFRQAHHAGVRALTSAHREPDEADPDFWSIYDREYTRTVGVPQERMDAARIAMRNRWDWLHQENIDAFHRLATTGLPLAIVSNNDGTAPEQMREFNVCQVGDGPLPSVAAIVDSTTEGVAKPDPAIFTPAIEALGLAPDKILYVGDTVHADVDGATAAGMQVIQLDPYDHHADLDHPRCPDLSSLLEQLPTVREQK